MITNLMVESGQETRNTMAITKQKIAIIGAGWYGCHLALTLQKAGHDVTLFEKNADIFSGISGEFGIRLHTGLHYPRSQETRNDCQRGFKEFIHEYPELVIDHEYSVYGLGAEDADGNAPKVNEEEFKKVSMELTDSQTLGDLSHYKGLLTATDIVEPSIVIGSRLRETFRKYLRDAGVTIRCNYGVNDIGPPPHAYISNGSSTESFDKVINTTSYQSLVPERVDFPFEMEVTYQPCLALIYEDTRPGEKPISFIVMDGWFPCMMPCIDNFETEKLTTRKYILTHGKWTIMASKETPQEAYQILNEVNDDFINKSIKPFSEGEMNRFWPEFGERFRYVGWKGQVLAKLKTRKEFRSALTYEQDGTIYVFPGKISNVFDVEREVKSLLLNDDFVLTNGRYRYVPEGVLEHSREEIAQKPVFGEPNTTMLQTFAELQQQTYHYPTPSDPSYEINLIISYNFQLQCLASLVAALAALAFISIILPLLGAKALALAGSAAIIGAGYSKYSLFANSQQLTQQASTDFECIPLERFNQPAMSLTTGY